MRTREEFQDLTADWQLSPDARRTFEDGLEDPTLIDAHAHIFPIEPYWGPGQTDLDELVATMDDQGVDRAVLLAEEQTEKGFKVPSWWVTEQAARYPDRLIPFCAIEPRMAPGRGTIASLVDEYVDRGAMGVGELKVGLPVDHERMQLVYELCAERGLPLLMHISEKHAIDEPGLPGLERMLETYPDLDLIMHAHGWWAHISADVTREQMSWYPDDSVEPGGRCAELLSTYDNCWADFSQSGLNAFLRDLDYAQTFLENHHESLIFGTDTSYLPTSPAPHFAMFERFDLPAEAWENIRYRNLEQVLPT